MVFCLLTALGTVFCTLMYRFNSDVTNITEAGQVVHRSLLFKNNGYTAVFTAFLVLCVAVFALSALIFRKTPFAGTGRLTDSIGLIFDRSITGMVLVSVVILQFRLETAYTPYEPSLLQYVSLLLALLASLYFFLPVFSKKSAPEVRIFLGSGLVGWLCCHILSMYFYTLDHLHSPTKSLALLGTCSLIYFFLLELRLVFSENQPDGKPSGASVGGFVAMGMIAAFLCIVGGFSSLFLSVWHSSGFSVTLDTFYTLCRLCMGFYALLSVLCTLLCPTGGQPLLSETEDPTLQPQPQISKEALSEAELPGRDGARTAESEKSGQSEQDEWGEENGRDEQNGPDGVSENKFDKTPNGTPEDDTEEEEEKPSNSSSEDAEEPPQ